MVYHDEVGFRTGRAISGCPANSRCCRRARSTPPPGAAGRGAVLAVLRVVGVPIELEVADDELAVARKVAGRETSPRRATGGRSQLAIPFHRGPASPGDRRRRTRGGAPARTETHAFHLPGPCSSWFSVAIPPRAGHLISAPATASASKRRQAKLAPARPRPPRRRTRRRSRAGRTCETARDPVVAAPRLDGFLLLVVDVPVPVGEAHLLVASRRG